MAEPVVVLELDPAGGEDVERLGRLELVAGQQPLGDLARARLELQLGHGSGAVASVGALRPKRVPTLPISGSVGSWLRAVVGAVLGQVVGVAAAPLPFGRGAGVVEVVLAQIVAVGAQVQQRDRASADATSREPG